MKIRVELIKKRKIQKNSQFDVNAKHGPTSVNNTVIAGHFQVDQRLYQGQADRYTQVWLCS